RGGRKEGHPYRCAPGLAAQPGRPLARRADRHPGLLLRVSLPAAVFAPGAAYPRRPPALVLDGDHRRRDRVCARFDRSDLGAAGGLAANVVGLRAIFLGGGVLLLLATIPVLFVVRESPRRVVRAAVPRTMDVLRAAAPGTIGALAVLIAAQGLQQTSYAAAQA